MNTILMMFITIETHENEKENAPSFIPAKDGVHTGDVLLFKPQVVSCVSFPAHNKTRT